MSKNLRNVEGTSEKLRRMLRSLEVRPTGSRTTLKALFVNYFVNGKIEQLQKIKTISFMKLTTVGPRKK